MEKRARLTEPLKTVKPEPATVDITLEEVESYSTHDYGCNNNEVNKETILYRLRNISFGRLAAMVRLSHLSPEDAGGEYLLGLLQQFETETLRMLHESGGAQPYVNPTKTMNPFTRQQAFDEMDEADKYDIIMSIYGENEAENTTDVDRHLRAIGNKTMDYLWQYAVQ